MEQVQTVLRYGSSEGPHRLQKKTASQPGWLRCRQHTLTRLNESVHYR
jgi:hypothetical protein